MLPKLIFVTYAYHPMQAPRATQIKRLVDELHTPIKIITSANQEGCPRIEGVDIHVVPDCRSKIRFFIDRSHLEPDGYLPWAVKTIKYIRENNIVRDGDIVVTFGMPMSDHLVGLNLKKDLNFFWISSFSDPWSRNPYNNYKLKRLAANSMLEDRVLELSDIIFFTSMRAIDFTNSGSIVDIKSKSHILPHSFNYNNICTAQITDPNKILIRYVGALYGKRSPYRLLKALCVIKKTDENLLKDIEFEFIGRNRYKYLMIFFNNLRKHIKFKGNVSQQESIKLMSEADILLSIDAENDSSIFFPSKIVDYMSVNKPILALTAENSVVANVINSTGGYILRNSDKLAFDLSNFLLKLKEDRTFLMKNSIDTSKYRSDIIANNFLQLIQKIYNEKKY